MAGGGDGVGGVDAVWWWLVTDVTVTVNVADFASAVPAGAVLRVSRASLDVSGTVIVSTAIQLVALPSGTGTVTLVAGVVYRFEFSGLTGMDAAWYASCTASMTAAELYRAHQVDPATLTPLPTWPTVADAIAALIARVTVLETGGGSGGGAGFQYTQSVAAATWNIGHALNRRPNVDLYTLAGERVFTDVTAADTSTVTVTFPAPATGYAVLS